MCSHFSLYAGFTIHLCYTPWSVNYECAFILNYQKILNTFTFGIYWLFGSLYLATFPRLFCFYPQLFIKFLKVFFCTLVSYFTEFNSVDLIWEPRVREQRVTKLTFRFLIFTTADVNNKLLLTFSDEEKCQTKCTASSFLNALPFIKKYHLWKQFENKARLRIFIVSKTVYMVCLLFDKIMNVFAFTFDIYPL